MFVYVAGPLTTGDRVNNLRNAILAADRLTEAGHIPYIPHLCDTWDLLVSHDYEFWMMLDFSWISKCDVLMRLPGDSAGADREMQFAIDHNIPVYTEAEFWNSVV